MNINGDTLSKIFDEYGIGLINLKIEMDYAGTRINFYGIKDNCNVTFDMCFDKKNKNIDTKTIRKQLENLFSKRD